MKVTTLLLLITTVFPAFSQEDTIGRFRIGIKTSPDITYRTLQSGNKNANTIKDLRDDMELPKAGYTAGLTFGFQLGPRLELETGAFYSSKGFKMEKVPFMTVDDPESTTYGQLFYSYQYLDVPVTLNAFFFTHKKLQLITSVSFTTNILLDAREMSRYTTDGSQQTTYFPVQAHYKSYAFSAEVGAGICWNLSKHFQLRALPTFRYGITKINDDPISARLWSGGLAVGCHYLF